MPATMAPMKGSTAGPRLRQVGRQDGRPQVAHARRSPREATAPEPPVRPAPGRPGPRWPAGARAAGLEGCREDRAGDGQPDRGPELTEEGERAGGHAHELGRHGRLHDGREHRRDGPEPEAGQEHGTPDERASRRPRVSRESRVMPATPDGHGRQQEHLPAARAGHDLPSAHGAHDEPQQQGHDLPARLRGAGAVHELEVARHEDDGHEEPSDREEDHDAGDREGRVPEEATPG